MVNLNHGQVRAKFSKRGKSKTAILSWSRDVKMKKQLEMKFRQEIKEMRSWEGVKEKGLVM